MLLEILSLLVDKFAGKPIEFTLSFVALAFIMWLGAKFADAVFELINIVFKLFKIKVLGDLEKPEKRSNHISRCINFINTLFRKVIRQILERSDSCIRAAVLETVGDKIIVIAEGASRLFSDYELSGNDVVVLEEFLEHKSISSVISKYGAQDLIVRKVITPDESVYYIVVELSGCLSDEARIYINERLAALDILIWVYNDVEKMAKNEEVSG